MNAKGRWPVQTASFEGRPAASAAGVKAEARPARRERFKEPPAGELAGRYRLLEQTAVFYTLPEKMLRSLARRLRPLEVARGERIVAKGDESSCIYFLESGHCELRVEVGPNRSVGVAQLGATDFFGETACIEGAPASETVVALDACRLLLLDRTALFNVAGSNTDFIAELKLLGEQRSATHAGVAAQFGVERTARMGSVSAFYSPKGGSGRTTLALNVAGLLATRYPGEVVLFDLSFPFAQAALMANLVPVSSLARVTEAGTEVAEENVLSAVLLHPAGLMILPGCTRPEEADLITADIVSGTLSVLRRNFKHVIVDLSAGMTDPVLAVLDVAEHVLLVVPPELTAVKSARDAHVILTDVLGIARDKISLIRNARAPKPTISDEAMERHLGMKVAIRVDFDGVRPERAALDGELLTSTDPGSEISRAAKAIADVCDAAPGRAAATPRITAQPLRRLIGGDR